MGKVEEAIVSAAEEELPAALAYGLSLACPAIPSFAWLILIKAVMNGDITLDHIQTFLGEHGITLTPDYLETRGQKAAADLAPGTTNISNATIGEQHG
jgi:hypothetical protein